MKATNQKWTSQDPIYLYNIKQTKNDSNMNSLRCRRLPWRSATTLQRKTAALPQRGVRASAKTWDKIWIFAVFEHLYCLNICNVWTSTMFEHLQSFKICNDWISAFFEYLPLWIFVIIKSILYFYKYIFKCLLNLTELKIIEIVGYWEKFCPLNLFLVANCSSAHANSRFHDKISQICFTRFMLQRYPGKYCTCF